MIVVDASIGVRWVLPETGTAEAEQLLIDDQRLIAPDLMNLEVHGAILRRYRENALTEQEARLTCEKWTGLLADGLLILQPNEDAFDQAVALSIKIKHTLTDCLYLALAIQTNATLVTADRKLYERGKAAYKHITLFGKAA